MRRAIGARARLLGSLAIAAGVALAGCATAPESPDFDVPRYDDRPPIRLDVAEIRVVESYSPPLEKPNVEHLVPVSPATAARRWAKDRLRAVGDAGTATLDIVDGAVIETGVETEGGLTGFLTTEPEARYTARLELAMRVERPRDSGQVRVRGTRSTGVLEGASINERERTLHLLVTNLMDDLDGQMSTTLAETFDQYIEGGV
jgi:hypothetical protein